MPNRIAARLVLIFSLVLIAALPVAAQVASPLITSPIDNSVRARVPHSTHPLATSRYEVGPVEPNLPMQRMILVLKSSPDQEARLQAFLDSQQTKGSPDYHHWLTPDEFGARFGPSQQDIQRVTNWLRLQGFTINQVAQSGRWVEFSGNARQVQAAFQTQMKYYQILGKMHVANGSEISIPAALSPVVGGMLSLHNFLKKPLLTHAFQVHRNSEGKLVPVRPDLTVNTNAGAFHLLAPGDYAKIYDLGSLYNSGFKGQNQTIAIVARSDINLADINNFRQTFKISGNNTSMTINGPDPGEDLFFGDGIEATLDTEWSGAVAPAAMINVVVSGSTLITDGVDLSAAFIVENNLAQVLSMSFGDCELVFGSQENAFWNALWQQAAAQGISVFVSSGDNGPAGCDDPNPRGVPASGIVGVSGTASTPFNTAVGGTEFNENGQNATFWNSNNSQTDFSSAIGYIPEVVWNESCSPGQVNTDCQGQSFFELFASSGGASGIYAKPSWQSTSITGVPNDGARDVPDISLAAAGGHDGYLICFNTGDPNNNFNCTSATDGSGNPILTNAGIVGGTSASSPSFAGIMAIIDQKVGGRQGLANYVLYNLAQAENFSNCNSNNRTNPGVGTSCVFNDVVTGNNSVPGEPGFSAGAGFDLTTGLGSVDANNLATAWATAAGGDKGSTTTLSVTSPALTAGVLKITHGQQVNATVSVASTTTGTPTGNVALVTDAAGAGGTGNATVGAGSLASGSFSGSFNNLPGGTYNLSAHYPGDGTFAASDSAGISVNVAKENSSTSLAVTLINVNAGIVPLASVAYGDPNNILVFDGTVAAASGFGFPSGTVSFADGGNGIGTAAMNNRAQAEVANCFTPLTCLTVGTHNITVSYPTGDNSFNSSGASNMVAITITKGNPSVAISSPQSEPGATPVSIAANIATNLGTITPTGTVQFFDSNVPLGSPAPVINGGASKQVTFNSSGQHNLSAQYSGDATYNGATGNSSVNVFAPFQFSASGGVAFGFVQAGSTATFNLNLSPLGSFNGAVAITCSGAPAGTTCTTNPATANVAGSTVPVTVNIATTTSARRGSGPFRTWSPFFAAVVGILVCGAGRKCKSAVLMLLALVLVVGIGGCGGGGGGGGTIPRAPTVANLTVTGTSGSFSNSINLILTINH